MLRSLRARLAFLFVGMLLLAGLIAALVVVKLYQSYVRDQTKAALSKQADAIAAYYTDALKPAKFNAGTKPVSPTQIQHMSDATLYYNGPAPFPNQSYRNNPAPGGIDPSAYTNLKPGEHPVVMFKPPGKNVEYLGVGSPVFQTGQSVGAVILAKPLSDVNNAWRNVTGPIAIGLVIGLIAAFILASLVARRITRPLTTIGAAADRVARGDLDVNVVTPRTSDDELGALTTRFQGMVDRLREVDELERNFLMRVTHELRTPLTAISGHVQAAADGVVPLDEMEDSMEAVTEEVRRLERLVNDLLDLTRLEAHQFRVVSEEVGLEALLEQAAASFREKARANDIDFDTTTAAAPTVMSDGDRVLQIVTNLLDNAFRWTPRGGEVKLACVTSSGIAAITVSDSGPGIAPADLQSVFHPFYSRRGEGGTGLGLSIARELAQALGGRLAVESELGKGSTFTLSLPRNRRRRRR
ncbi:MAG TPA: HAMP domain-containing sensor histidine kinase [Gaiellales bacterium]|nr:HAMP domain-containing sensor histidine kinase [Gaiellales bacterium]